MVKSLYDFDNYREFLSFLYRNRKEKNPRYSMRKFGRDLGFSSPNHMADVINGSKNLGKQGIDRIARSLQLADNKKDYLSFLVELSTCVSETERKSKIQSMKRLVAQSETKEIDSHGAYFIKNRMCSLLSILIDIYGDSFEADPVWVMRRIRVKSSPEEINEALSFLMEHRFVTCDQGIFRNTSQAISTPVIGLSRLIKEVHKGLMDESLTALELSPDQREYASVTASIAFSDFRALKEKIKNMREELNLWLINKTGKTQDRLGVTINFQMYPITTDLKQGRKK